MSRNRILALAVVAAALAVAASFPSPSLLDGRVVAVGIPGISAIAPVGTFLPGSPISSNPAFAATTQPGRVLDPDRILVGSTSNFGQPKADAAARAGSFLSIDPRGSQVLVVPPRFAAAGGQASALGGMVQMYSSQNAAFLNSIHNPAAPTATFTGVTNPLGMSINNAFGRLWPANAPYGLDGIGTSTILDPTGEPLANAPNPARIGGVYAGDLTGRAPAQEIPGELRTGAVGTALLGRSPDGSGRAVFAVVCADGSIVQEHTEQGLDGLAAAGTIDRLVRRRWAEDPSGAQLRLGVLLNYEPDRILYVSEPLRNRIAVLSLNDDGVVFRVAAVRHLSSRFLDEPIDLAPVAIETEDGDWSSNTTLEEGSDFYVANRGDNTIVRMRQDGTVVAVRRVGIHGWPVFPLRLNGIATSPDGTRIWVTMTGHVLGGVVLELPSF